MKRMQIVAKDPLPVIVKNGCLYTICGMSIATGFVLSWYLSLIQASLKNICDNQCEINRQTQESLAVLSWKFDAQNRYGDTKCTYYVDDGKLYAKLCFSTNFIGEVLKCTDGNLNR